MAPLARIVPATVPPATGSDFVERFLAAMRRLHPEVRAMPLPSGDAINVS